MMCSGRYLEELWIQQQVNLGLMQVSKNVMYNRYVKRCSVKEAKIGGKKDLYT